MENSIIISNLPENATEDQILGLFRQFGEISKIKIIEPGKATCEFTSNESVENATKQNQQLNLLGSTLTISEKALSLGGGDKSNINKLVRDLETALGQMKIQEKYDVLVEVKAWVKTDPEGVRDILSQRPMVAQALLKMFIEMKMLQTPPPADLAYGAFSASELPSLPTSSPSPPPPSSQSISSSQQQQQQSGLLQEQLQYQQYYQQQYPPQYGYQQQQMYYQQSPEAYYYTQQQQQNYYGAGYYPPQQQQQQLPGLSSTTTTTSGSGDYQTMLRSVMSMSDADIAKLHPQQQEEIRHIRLAHYYSMQQQQQQRPSM